MNYAAMRWVMSPDCKVKGSARAVLGVIAYHADNKTGECWAGQRRLAEASGLARSTVQLALDKLFADCVLEPLEDARGPKPERYQIAPGLVESAAGGSGVVECSGSATNVVEGQAVAGEVIHNPTASGPTVGPQGLSYQELVDRNAAASGPIQGDWWRLVDRSYEASGPTASQANNALTSAKSGMSVAQGLKQVSLKAREEQVVGADSTADAVGADVAEPPPVDESVIRNLRRIGLAPTPDGRSRPPPSNAKPRTREQQLAAMQRSIAAEERERQEREAATRVAAAAAQTATVGVAAQDADVYSDSYGPAQAVNE